MRKVPVVRVQEPERLRRLVAPERGSSRFDARDLATERVARCRGSGADRDRSPRRSVERGGVRQGIRCRDRRLRHAVVVVLDVVGARAGYRDGERSGAGRRVASRRSALGGGEEGHADRGPREHDEPNAMEVGSARGPDETIAPALGGRNHGDAECRECLLARTGARSIVLRRLQQTSLTFVRRASEERFEVTVRHGFPPWPRA